MNKPNSPYESPLHEALGLTDAQIRQELQDQGLDPASEAGALHSMIGALTGSRWAPKEHRSEEPCATGKRLAYFDEAVAAGAPNPARTFCQPVDRGDIMDLLRMADPDTVMWARVSGWSMRDEGIRDGDCILIDTKAKPRDGDIVLAHLAGEGQVVKRLRLPGGENGKSAVLESANPDFAPIVISDPASLTIHGVVVGRAGRL